MPTTVRKHLISVPAYLPSNEQCTAGCRQYTVCIANRCCPPLGEKLLDPDGKLTRSVQVFVDGRNASHLPDGLETKLRADQSVDIFPAIAGG